MKIWARTYDKLIYWRDSFFESKRVSLVAKYRATRSILLAQAAWRNTFYWIVENKWASFDYEKKRNINTALESLENSSLLSHFGYALLISPLHLPLPAQFIAVESPFPPLLIKKIRVDIFNVICYLMVKPSSQVIVHLELVFFPFEQETVPLRGFKVGAKSQSFSSTTPEIYFPFWFQLVRYT